MSGLSRQNSRLNEIVAYLTQVIGLQAEPATIYADGLIEEGFDSPTIFDELTMQELIDDYGFKRGHALKVQKSQMERGVGHFAPGGASSGAAGGGAVAVGTIVSEPEPAEEGVPPQLPDGSTVEVLSGGEHVLGRGASGIVRKGIMTKPNGAQEEVACKSLAPGATEREHELFQKEYELSYKVAMTCPLAAKTYGCFRSANQLELVMKLYTGSLLQKMEPPADAPPGTARTPFAVPDAIRYGLQLARALEQLHDKDIKIGDVKPANLLLDEHDTLVIADFGISELMTTTVTSTSTGRQGTPAYTAPEQFDSDIGKVSFLSDIWAWGCIMYEMLVGEPPWFKQKEMQIMTAVTMKKQHPQIPAAVMDTLDPHIRSIIDLSFAFSPHDRPTASQIIRVLASEPTRLIRREPGHHVYLTAESNLLGSWAKKDTYEVEGVLEVQEIVNPRLQAVYDAYKATISAHDDAVVNGNELLCFHGCANAAMDVSNPDSIVQTGFLKKYWQTSAGAWQRFGPGFYFGTQSSKSHEYPLPEMKQLKNGHHNRKMLLCKVARGKIYKTQSNLDTLQGDAPQGYHSVHGDAQKHGDLNYDEIVVYKEAAVLPYAVVEYKFHKHAAGGAMAAPVGGSPGPPQARRLHTVGVAGMGAIGPGVAAEFALHGIAVRVWQDPDFTCEVCGRARCRSPREHCPPSAAEYSKKRVLKALISAQSAAGLDVLTDSQDDTAREGRTPAAQGGGGSDIDILTTKLVDDRFIAAAQLVTGCNTPTELVEGLQSMSVAAGAAEPLQIVIDALPDIVAVKLNFFDEVCKSPFLPPDAFLTSNSLSATLNLSLIADKLGEAYPSRRQNVLGLRFIVAGPGAAEAGAQAIGVRVVEGFYINDPTQAGAYPADVGEVKLRELSRLMVEANKIVIMPTKNSTTRDLPPGQRSRGWDRLCPAAIEARLQNSVNFTWLRSKAGGSPRSQIAAQTTWDLSVCLLCSGPPSAAQQEQVGDGSHMFICNACEGTHNAAPSRTQFEGASCREIVDVARSLGFA